MRRNVRRLNREVGHLHSTTTAAPLPSAFLPTAPQFRQNIPHLSSASIPATMPHSSSASGASDSADWGVSFGNLNNRVMTGGLIGNDGVVASVGEYGDDEGLIMINLNDTSVASNSSSGILFGASPSRHIQSMDTGSTKKRYPKANSRKAANLSGICLFVCLFV